MNFVSNKADFASHDGSFYKNLVQICKKCCSYQPDNTEFLNFFEESKQIEFLNSESDLLEEDRFCLKTLYINNEMAFLACNQLWLKFGHEFFYLENRTIKFAILFEINKVKTLLNEKKSTLWQILKFFQNLFF